MAKMAHARENHGHIVLVRRRNNFRIAHRASRLNGRSSTGLGRGCQTVGKREKGIAAYDTAADPSNAELVMDGRTPDQSSVALPELHATYIAGGMKG